MLHFRCQLGSILAPKSIKIHAKSDLKRHQKNDRFLLSIFDRFWLRFGAVLAPKIAPGRCQEAVLGLRTAPKSSPNAAKRVQEKENDSRTPPRRLRDAPGDDFAAFWLRFGFILGTVLHHFCVRLFPVGARRDSRSAGSIHLIKLESIKEKTV